MLALNTPVLCRVSLPSLSITPDPTLKLYLYHGDYLATQSESLPANLAESRQWLRYPNNSFDLGGANLSSFEYLLKYTTLGGLADILKLSQITTLLISE